MAVGLMDAVADPYNGRLAIPGTAYAGQSNVCLEQSDEVADGLGLELGVG